MSVRRPCSLTSLKFLLNAIVVPPIASLVERSAEVTLSAHRSRVPSLRGVSALTPFSSASSARARRPRRCCPSLRRARARLWQRPLALVAAARTIASTSARSSIASPWCESKSVGSTSATASRASASASSQRPSRARTFACTPRQITWVTMSSSARIRGLRGTARRPRRSGPGRRRPGRASRSSSRAGAPSPIAASFSTPARSGDLGELGLGRRAAGRTPRGATRSSPSVAERVRVVVRPRSRKRSASSKSPFIACSGAERVEHPPTATGLAPTSSRNSSQRRIASSTGVGPSTAAVARQPRTSNSSRSSPARRAHSAASPTRRRRARRRPAIHASWARSDQTRHWP